MRSITRQLALVTIVLVGAVLVAAGVGLYAGIRSALHAQFDRTLHAKAMSVLSQVSWDAKGVEFEATWEVMPSFVGGDDAEYFLVTVDPDDEVARSPSLRRSQTLPAPTLDGRDTLYWNAALPDGRDGRGLTMRFALEFDDEDDEAESDDVPPEQFVPDELKHGRLTVAAGREEITRPLALLVVSLAIVGVVLALLVPLVVTMAVRVGLRPVRRLNDEVEAIDARHLDRRLDVDEMPIELRATVDRMNALLARLAEAFAREQRFAAGAAHELRTPLAELRTAAEVALRTDDPSSGAHAALTEIVAAATEMEALLEGLLEVARGEAARPGRTGESIDLAPIVRTVVDRYASSSSARDVRIETAIETRAPVLGDRALLAAIIDNVIANASRYAPAGTAVRIRTSTSAGTVRLEVENDAPDLAAAEMPALFEPFWRKDASRASGGVGLGLTVARTLARTMRGDLDATLDESSSALTLRLTLPIAPDPA